MTFILLFIATFVIFVGIEVLGLGLVVRPVFERALGDQLLDEFRVAPAVLFYAFYIGVLIWFVSAPALAQDKNMFWVIGNAALFAAACYGTYEFASLAIMKDWSWAMVWTDMTWGTCVTCASAVGGVWITRMLT